MNSLTDEDLDKILEQVQTTGQFPPGVRWAGEVNDGSILLIVFDDVHGLRPEHWIKQTPPAVGSRAWEHVRSLCTRHA
jgi:hypothetical protein